MIHICVQPLSWAVEAHCQNPCHPLNLVPRGAGGQDNLIALIHWEFLWLWGRSPWSVREKAFKSSAQTQCKQVSQKLELTFLLLSCSFLRCPFHEREARFPRVTKITIIHRVPSNDMEIKNLTKWFSWGTGAGLVSEKMSLCCNQT